MKTIQAKVNSRLLTKASRLFTGTLEGRVIEILQNARRAGATQIEITNRPDGMVVVHDNGRGIEDFAKLLDMGGSGWDETLENSEDPAGVGLFCLAPRSLTVRSNSQMATIEGNGWTGGPVTIEDDPEPVRGTMLCFQDDPWAVSLVEMHAVFTGLQVSVDGCACPSLPFISDTAVHCPELGCRIEVRPAQKLDSWHHSSRQGRYYGSNVLVNFHGQVVVFHYRPLSEDDLNFLVDLTGEPTGIRLMLPARTQLVENEALVQLKDALKLEALRYIQKRGHHRLRYKEWLEARQLRIELPEADPTFRVGLLVGEDPEPVQVLMPEGFPLQQCYRFDPDQSGDETDEANVHLLAALGHFERQPFVPVEISGGYDGYSWANLPTVDQVTLHVGRILHQAEIWGGKLVCVDSLTIAAGTSDGKTYTSPVCMAVRPPLENDSHVWWDQEVLVTPEAREELGSTYIMYHLGGYSEEGDTWDTQDEQFSEQLDRFWDHLVGPDEHLRRRITEPLHSLEGWEKVVAYRDGRVVIRLKDGTERALIPPQRSRA